MLTIRSAQVGQMAQAAPGRQMVIPCQDSKTWIEFQLVDQDDAPVPNQRYLVQLPDGSQMNGNLDAEGRARFDPIVPGTCQINFPDIADQEWQPA